MATMQDANEEREKVDKELEQRALSLDWIFGVGDKVESLQTETSDEIVYTAEHTGVLYSPSTGRMRMLQAHCNAITALSVTSDKSVIATADAGPGSFIVLWDAETATPLRSLTPPHAGVLAMDFSPDGKLLATVSAPSGSSGKQSLCIWQLDSGALVAATVIIPAGDVQYCVRFRPEDTRELVTNGKVRVFFWTWTPEPQDDTVTITRAKQQSAENAADALSSSSPAPPAGMATTATSMDSIRPGTGLGRGGDNVEDDAEVEDMLAVGSVRFYSPPVSDRDFKQRVGEYVSSIFVPGLASAVTGTHDGDLVVWEPVKAGGGAVSAQQKQQLKDDFGDVPGGGEDSALGPPASQVQARRATKILRVLPNGMSSLVRSGAHMYCGSRDGGVRIFNSRFGLVSWRDNIDSDAIVAIGISASGASPGGGLPTSMSVEDGEDVATDRGLETQSRSRGFASLSKGFAVADSSIPGGDEEATSAFVVTTASNRLLLVTPAIEGEDEPPAKVLMQGPRGGAGALASHPLLPLVASVGDHGCAEVWDIERRVLVATESSAIITASATTAADAKSDEEMGTAALMKSQQQSQQPQASDSVGAHGSGVGKATALCFVGASSGTLVVGYASGLVRFLDHTSLAESASMRLGQHSIQSICATVLASDGRRLVAASDSGRTVTLLVSSADTRKPSRWELVGKHRAHAGPICGLTFAGKNNDRLLSVGADCRLVEYAALADAGTGLGILRSTDLAASATPTCMLALGDRVLIADDEFKLRRYELLDTSGEREMECTSTVLGPTHGGPLRVLLASRGAEEAEDGASDTPSGGWVAFASAEKVVGIGMLPLDGSPSRCTALIAHPGPISGVCVCAGSVASASVSPSGQCTLGVWRCDAASLADRALQEEAEALSRGVSKFAAHMVEGGEHGAVYQELLEYFYYAQIHAQGEATLERRKITHRISFDEVPGLLRALGFYPSGAELRALELEARRSGADADGLGLEDFVRLYTNHRPLYNVGLDDVQRAFVRLGCDATTGKLDWETLKAALRYEGEPMSEEELNDCLYNLIGVKDAALPPLDSEEFASAVLGFEVEVEGAP